MKRTSHSWLDAAAIEVNRVWNWCNERSLSVYRNTGRRMSGFDLANALAGHSQFFDKIGAEIINAICLEYESKRRAAGKPRLCWRASTGSRKALGWVPFKGRNIRRDGNAFVLRCHRFAVFDADYFGDAKPKDGCFAQDACGDWWLCIPVDVARAESVAPREAVGIDLGLKTIATTSDGETLGAGAWTERYAGRLAMAQRRGHRRQAKRIHRKAARCRADALHKFSRKIVDSYQKIVIGDVSSKKLVKTRMAKSVLDSGWGMLKTQLRYKGEHAGRTVEVVSEAYTTRACSSCGCLSGPSGLRQLVVREWSCSECGVLHDRDINAARNILNRAEASASACGNHQEMPARRQVRSGR